MLNMRERREYRIKPEIRSFIERDWIYLLPTILYVPWRRRFVGCHCMEFHWLVFVVSVGRWEVKDNG